MTQDFSALIEFVLDGVSKVPIIRTVVTFFEMY